MNSFVPNIKFAHVDYSWLLYNNLLRPEGYRRMTHSTRLLLLERSETKSRFQNDNSSFLNLLPKFVSVFSFQSRLPVYLSRCSLC